MRQGPHKRKRVLFGRNQLRKLRKRQQQLMRELLPRVQATPGDRRLADPPSLFEHNPKDVFLEIGFGAGEHLADLAVRHPANGYMGAEPFVNGMAKMLSRIERQSIDNIRLYHGDARDLIEELANCSIAGVFLLYPDPWIKKRHNKRRFVSQENLSELHRILRPGAEFFFASDITDYVCWTLKHMAQHGGFTWTAEEPADWRNPPCGWPGTRYEAKAIREGRRGHYLRFRKI